VIDAVISAAGAGMPGWLAQLTPGVTRRKPQAGRRAESSPGRG